MLQGTDITDDWVGLMPRPRRCPACGFPLFLFCNKTCAPFLLCPVCETLVRVWDELL